MTTVGVIGLGYVGLPLAVAFARAGLRGHRGRRRRAQVDGDRGGAAPTSRTSPRRSCATVARADRTPRTRYAELATADAVLICVPTPLTPNREPDLAPLDASHARARARCCSAGQLVVLESTTYPGTTRERVAPLLEASGLTRRARLPPGVLARARRSRAHGLHAAQHAEGRRRADRRPARERARASSTAASATRWCASPAPEAAELTKLLENIFRSVNIALVNELAMLDRPHGHRHLGGRRRRGDASPTGSCASSPGPGMGGHCLPGRSLLPLLARARVRHVDRVHRARRQGQPADALPLRREARSARSTTPACRCKGARIAVLGVSYKPGVGDVRESPALKIIALLRDARRRASSTTTRTWRRCPSSICASRAAGARRWRTPTSR